MLIAGDLSRPKHTPWRARELSVESGGKKRFCLVLVKPSHYDDDGYVIQWFRSPIPSTSLAALYGLAQDCADRRVLGPDVEIDVHAFDETNTRIRCDRLAAMIDAAGAGMVMLVGVQSNQFPRALDLATTLRKRDIPVAIGGFHVSGTLSMLDDADPDLKCATAMGVSLFAGEAEGRLERVLQDADAGALAPLYNFMDDLPGIDGTPIPLLAAETVRRTAGGVTSFDAGRGCPFQCSFCTIINVQGRKSRRRSPADVEKIVRLNYAEGMHSFFITDDNFARNKDWEPILDRLIYLREVEKLNIGFIIQVDTLCHRLPNFIEKCARAGVRRVFIGLENINPDNLLGAKKRQNKITEYREMLLAWKAARVGDHRSPSNVAGGVGAHLSERMATLLHDRSYQDRASPPGFGGSQRGQRVVLAHLVQGQHRFREDAPARMRVSATQVPPRSTTWLPDRAGLALLSEVSHRDRRESGALDLAVSAAAAPLSAHQT